MVKTKVCTKCKRTLPCTSEYFYRLYRGKDGFKSVCKECLGHKFMITDKKQYNYTNREGYRICSTCGQEKPLNENYYSKRDYGFRYECKECRRNREANRRKNENDKINSKRRINRASNIENARLKQKLYYSLNCDKIKSESIISRFKRKSLIKKLDFNYSVKLWNDCKTYFGNKCCYCGNETNLSQDHFIALSNGGEYTVNNIVPACQSCNSSKNYRDFFEWYPKQPFYSKKREEKILKYLNYNKNKKVQQLTLAI